ncbi:MAG: alpha-galactosidase [Thermodesulfobacteriota bacterium]|nr:alpha-galactosidase [Thermodesulfobacteriota bacterium]
MSTLFYTDERCNKLFALCVLIWAAFVWSSGVCYAGNDNLIYKATLKGKDIMIFNGIPLEEGWGESLVYRATKDSADTRTMGSLGGLPVVDIFNHNSGIAFFNTSTFQEPFTIRLTYYDDRVTIEAWGGSHIERFIHKGDYYEAVREFALRMQKKGLSVQPAPAWAFDPIWETYGFEEDFDSATIRKMLPLLKELGIKTITIDSGWYGHGRGDQIDFYTGDFEINPDTIGSEREFKGLIRNLHAEGFRVRLWWAPGVSERGTKLARQHPDWFYRKAESSTGETGDYYLDPTNPEVVAWNRALVKRLIGYGVDGFKQDDVFHIITKDPKVHQAYAKLFKDIFRISQELKTDFTVNTCNCGLAQNFYQINSQNQIITSDPVGSDQFRHRAKYLHALNINGAAILGDHVELTKGDVGPQELKKAQFYKSVDFASVVPLGMVLQTKFRRNPGSFYRKWFEIYHKYRFYQMKWVNIPLIPGRLEQYLMRCGEELYFSFFTGKPSDWFFGEITLSRLKPQTTYEVYDIVNEISLGEFIADNDRYRLNVKFKGSYVLQVKPIDLNAVKKPS